jgi:hypothetical protein
MRRITEALLLTLVLACILLSAGAPAANVIAIKSSPPEALGLSIKVEGEQYCIGDSELDGLRLKARLVYTNHGKETLILYKGSTTVSRLMISRTFADAAAKRFEVDSSLTAATSGGEKCYRGSVPSTCFVSLQPNASYEVETNIRLFVVRGDARAITGAVMSGDHLLQVEVPTWHESNELAEQVGRRWQQNGTLWSTPVTSAPLLFTVKKEHQVVDCP